MIRPLLLALFVLLVLAAPARAGDPIMPLEQVGQGQRCTAYSVFQGTRISTFDAEVVDVVAGDRANDAPRILLRFSGPAIDRTGVGPGFSGSPIYCPDRDGVQRVIGAISESVGEYGGTLALATPIQQILDQPVEPPTGIAPGPPASQRRTLAAPISLGGLAAPVGRLFSRAAARAGRVVYASPARPRAQSFPPQELRPGAAMAVGLSSGDITAGAVGTVAYTDGDRVWGFGHALDGAGRRSLFLQDAYVFAIVNNPVQVDSASTYKLAAPGHDLGLLSGDGLHAVAGRLGATPDRFPMRVSVRDKDTGRQAGYRVEIADETALGLPTGTSALSLVGGAAIAQAASTILRGSPSRQTGDMCAKITVRERKEPFKFCNRYVTRGASEDEAGGLGVGGPMVGDFIEAVTAMDDYNFAALHVTGVEVGIRVRRGLRQAFLLKGSAPDVVRRGRTIRVRARIQQVRGRAVTRTVRVRVPRGMPAGERLLTLEGAPADTGGNLEIDLSELLFGAEEEQDGAEDEGGDEAGPRTIRSLAKVIDRLERYDGVQASFDPPDGDDTSLEDLGEERGGPESIARKRRNVLRDRTSASAARSGSLSKSGSFGLRSSQARTFGRRYNLFSMPSGAGDSGVASGTAGASGEAGASAPSASCSSPASNISMTMSLPPISSPSTNSCGVVGQLEIALSSWRMRGSGRMSTAANGTPTACSAPAARALKPHMGCSGVPFMKRMTLFSWIAPAMASRRGSALRSWGLRLELQRVDRPAELARAEGVVHQPVLLDPAQARERVGADVRLEVHVVGRGDLGDGPRDLGLDALFELVWRGHSASEYRTAIFREAMQYAPVTFTDLGARKVQEFLASQDTDTSTRAAARRARRWLLGLPVPARLRPEARRGPRLRGPGPEGLRRRAEPALRARLADRLHRSADRRRVPGQQPERRRRVRLRLFVPRAGRGRGLGRLSRSAGGRSWRSPRSSWSPPASSPRCSPRVGDEPGPLRPDAHPAGPAAAAARRDRAPRTTSRPPDTGRLAIGLSERNASLLFAGGARATDPAGALPRARRGAATGLLPAPGRLGPAAAVAGQAAALGKRDDGCLRGIAPCGAYAASATSCARSRRSSGPAAAGRSSW
jgi:hypothetical protein